MCSSDGGVASWEAPLGPWLCKLPRTCPTVAKHCRRWACAAGITQHGPLACVASQLGQPIPVKAVERAGIPHAVLQLPQLPCHETAPWSCTAMSGKTGAALSSLSCLDIKDRLNDTGSVACGPPAGPRAVHASHQAAAKCCGGWARVQEMRGTGHKPRWPRSWVGRCLLHGSMLM